MRLTDDLRKSCERVRDLPHHNYGHRSGRIVGMPGWVGYTNGYSLVAFVCDEQPEEELAATGAGEIVKSALAANAAPVTRDALSAFAGTYPVPPDLPTCEKCGGDGRIPCAECRGEGAVNCECHCGDEHENDCEECDGEGSGPCPIGCEQVNFSPAARPGVVAGVVVDLNLLALLLEACPLDRLTIGKGSDRVLLRGEEWIGALMELHRTGPDGLPRFSA